MAMQLPSGNPLRIAQPPTFMRGPRYLQAVLGNPREATVIPRPEKYLGTNQDGPSLRMVISLGSEPEWRVFWALLSLQLQADRDFDYQASQMGGRLQLGGAVLDFLLPAFGLAFNVQGEYWHNRNRAVQARDELTSAAVAAHGFLLIAMDEDDCMERPRGVVAAGLRGEDWSDQAAGF